jgi:hypothetical protein
MSTTAIVMGVADPGQERAHHHGWSAVSRVDRAAADQRGVTFGSVRRRVKVVGRLPGERSALSLV